MTRDAHVAARHHTLSSAVRTALSRSILDSTNLWPQEQRF